MTQQPTSFARIIVTPIILVLTGLLIFGIYGAAVGAIIGVVYIIWASRRGRTAGPTKREVGMQAWRDLDALRQAGTITEQEYEAKRAELLRRM